MDQPKLVAFTLVALAFALTTAISAVYTTPIGADIHFHFRVAQVWADGGNGMFSPYVFTINKFPYPPLFHWLLVPSVHFNLEYEFARLLQVLFYPLTLASSMWLMWKQAGKTQALLSGMLLLSTLSMIDGCLQVKPQAVDMLLLPLILYCFLKDKTWPFVALSAILVYSHGLASLILLSGPLLYGLILNKRDKKFWCTILLTLPIIIISVIYLPGAFNMWGATTDTPQEQKFWTNPLFFTVPYIGSSILALPIIIHNLTKWHSLTKLEKTLMFTVAGLCLMFLPWADRYLQYIVLPFSFLTASFVAKSRWKPVLMPVLIMVFAFYVCVPWFWLSANGYYIGQNPYK